jgi:hypothetical protein
MSHSNPEVKVLYDGYVKKLRIETYRDKLLVMFVDDEEEVVDFRFDLVK